MRKKKFNCRGKNTRKIHERHSCGVTGIESNFVVVEAVHGAGENGEEVERRRRTILGLIDHGAPPFVYCFLLQVNSETCRVHIPLLWEN
jgi:hypothetical protein